MMKLGTWRRLGTGVGQQLEVFMVGLATHPLCNVSMEKGGGNVSSCTSGSFATFTHEQQLSILCCVSNDEVS